MQVLLNGIVKEKLAIYLTRQVLLKNLCYRSSLQPLGITKRFCVIILFNQKETNVSLEDDVEMPEFHNEGDFTCSPRKAFTCNPDEEIISDDEVQRSMIKIWPFARVFSWQLSGCPCLFQIFVVNVWVLFQSLLSLWQDSNVLCNLFGKENNVLSTFSATSGTKKFHKDCLQSFRSGKQDGPQTWFAVSKEVDELIHLNKNPSCSSSHSAPFIANKSFKGVSSFFYDCLTLMIAIFMCIHYLFIFAQSFLVHIKPWGINMEAFFSLLYVCLSVLVFKVV